MKKCLFALSMLFFASVSEAQVITDYSISFYAASNPNGTSISAPYTFTKDSPALKCNQAKTTAPTTTVVNPRFYSWIDPDNPAAECVFDKTLATTPLFSDPPPGGDYVARMTAMSRVGTATLTSELSEPSNPFVRGIAPPAVLNFRVTGQ